MQISEMTLLLISFADSFVSYYTKTALVKPDKLQMTKWQLMKDSQIGTNLGNDRGLRSEWIL
jgi:hypothetical protein